MELSLRQLVQRVEDDARKIPVSEIHDDAIKVRSELRDMNQVSRSFKFTARKMKCLRALLDPKVDVTQILNTLVILLMLPNTLWDDVLLTIEPAEMVVKASDRARSEYESIFGVKKDE